MTDVKLPPKLVELTEQLAENTHDLWAREVWRRDGNSEQSVMMQPRNIPALFPTPIFHLGGLSDRESAMGTLKAILALGYVITPPP